MRNDIENLVNDGFTVARLTSESENGYAIKLPDDIKGVKELQYKLDTGNGYGSPFMLGYDPENKSYKLAYSGDDDEAIRYRPTFKAGDALFLNEDSQNPEIIRINKDVHFVQALTDLGDFKVEGIELPVHSKQSDGVLVMVREKHTKPQHLLGFITADYDFDGYNDPILDAFGVVLDPTEATAFLNQAEAELVIQEAFMTPSLVINGIYWQDLKFTLVTL